MSDIRQGCICINGRFVEPEQAKVSAFDAGFLLGDGLFESLRASGGVPYLLDRHLERLFAGAAEFEFENVPRGETITEQVYRALQRSELLDAYVRITMTRGTDAVGLAPPPGPPTIVISVLPALPRKDDDGLKSTLLYEQAAPCVTAKSTSWQRSVMARRRVERLGADEGIYVSSDGRVLEGVTSNVFMVNGDTLYTPHASEGLPGITRSRLLELARDAGIAVLEGVVTREALQCAEEVFVTNAIQGLRWISSIDGVVVNARAGDGLFSELLTMYRADRGSMVGARG